VLTLALFAIWAKNRSRFALAAMVVAAFLWTFTRQDILLFIAVVAAALAVYAWRSRDRRLAASAAAAVLVLGLGWHVAILSTLDTSYQSWGAGFRLSESTFLYRLRLQVMRDPRMKAVYENRFGMPRCIAAEQVAKRDAWSMPEFGRAYRSCPDLVAWFDQHGTQVGYQYALGEPKHYLRVLLTNLPKTMNGDIHTYAKPVPLLPAAVTKVFFPPTPWVLPVLFGVLVLAMATAMWSRAWRRRPWLTVAGTVLVATSLASIVTTLMYAAGEYSRFGIQEAVFLRIGLIIVIAGVIDAFFSPPSTPDGPVRA
jgi:hypothetical protein